MTTVTGDLTQAGLVTFYLVDQDGRHVKDAFITGGTIVGEVYKETSTSGVYSVSNADGVYPNIDIQANATQTYWVRSFRGSQRRLLVPASGTWDELQIAADPPPASPNPTATNLITSAVIESPVTGLVVDAFTFAAVAGTLVTVPDLAFSTEIRGTAPIVCAATANIDVAGVITNMTAAANKAVHYTWAGTANLPYTVTPRVVLPPHSAGNYQLKVYSFSSVTLKVDAQPSQQAGLWVYSV